MPDERLDPLGVLGRSLDAESARESVNACRCIKDYRALRLGSEREIGAPCELRWRRWVRVRAGIDTNHLESRAPSNQVVGNHRVRDEHLIPESEFVMPRSPEEEKIAAIWREILGQERISVHHNFFDLGGHSLAAVQVINRLRREFDLELPLRVIFEAQTISELATRIAAR